MKLLSVALASLFTISTSVAWVSNIVLYHLEIHIVSSLFMALLHIILLQQYLIHYPSLISPRPYLSNTLQYERIMCTYLYT